MQRANLMSIVVGAGSVACLAFIGCSSDSSTESGGRTGGTTMTGGSSGSGTTGSGGTTSTGTGTGGAGGTGAGGTGSGGSTTGSGGATVGAGGTTGGSGGTTGGAGGSTGGSGGTGGPDGGGSGMTYDVSIGPVMLAPGEERIVCVDKKLPTTAAIDMVKITSDLTLGGHHLVFYKSAA